METNFDEYPVTLRSDSIICGKCGKRGKVVWDDLSRLTNNAPEPELLGIDGPFFERISRKPPYPIELICRECGGVAVTAYPSTRLHDRRGYN